MDPRSSAQAMKRSELVQRRSPWRLVWWEAILLLLAAFFAFWAAASTAMPNAGSYHPENSGLLLVVAALPAACALLSYLIRAVVRASRRSSNDHVGR